MALLLPIPAEAQPSEEGLGRTPAVLAAASASLSTAPSLRMMGRSALREAIQNDNYVQIARQRLSHIPKKLPYSVRAIIARLKENDATEGDRAIRERTLDLETDLGMIAQEMSRRPRRTMEDARTRRLSQLWAFLSGGSERTGLVVDHRRRRFANAVRIFLQSDLPPVFLTSAAESVHWEIAALALGQNALNQRFLQQVLGRPAEEVDREVFMSAKASLSALDRAFRDYQKRLGEITLLADRILEWRDALEYYVDLYSAPDLQSFRRPRFITESSLDLGIIDELAQGLQDATAEVRRTLAADYPGGLSGFRWAAPDNPYVAGLIQLELGAEEAG